MYMADGYARASGRVGTVLGFVSYAAVNTMREVVRL
jgi:thiamine pyrophosphate-dependent acetolactate synthase large subunit-like protein